MLKYGIVGLGNMSVMQHIPAVKNHLKGKVEISAICDVYAARIKKAEEEFGLDARHYHDYKDMLDKEELNAVILVTPNNTHKDIVIDILGKNIGILCEKPMGINLEECNTIIDAANNSKAIMQVVLEYRYSRLFNKVKKIIDRGDIGEVRFMWCKEFRGPFLTEWRYNNKISGGSFVEKNCHHFDLFNWMCGKKPVKVCAFGGSDVLYKKGQETAVIKIGDVLKEIKQPEVIDNGWVIVEYEDGVRASLGLCMFSERGNELEIGIIGDKGKVEVYGKSGIINVYDRNSNDVCKYDVLPMYQEEKLHSGIVDMHLSFYECLVKKMQSVVNAQIGKDSIEIAVAAQKSIDENRIVNLYVGGQK